MLGQADSGDLGDDLSDLFVALGEAAAEHETGIVFLLLDKNTLVANARLADARALWEWVEEGATVFSY